MFRSLPVFPFRSPAGGQQPRLPVCRAWRIVRRLADDFAVTLPAVIDGKWPVGVASLLAGIYPVLVRRTDPAGGELGPLLCVEGDGWQAVPMGPDWGIEYVMWPGPVTDRYAYVVECTDDLRECGQVNAVVPPELYMPKVWLSQPFDCGRTLTVMRDGLALFLGTAQSGNAITSTVLNIPGVETVLVVADNSAGAVARNLVIDLRDGDELIDTWTVSIAAGIRGKVVVGHGAVATGLAGALAVPVPPRMQVTLQAGGAAAGKLWVFGR